MICYPAPSGNTGRIGLVVIYGKVPTVMSGFTIGGSLLLGIALAVLLGSNGILNPGVALGIGSFNVMYVLGPVIGSVFGMTAYRHVALQKE